MAEEKKPRHFLRSNCGWMNWPHFANREYAKHYKCSSYKPVDGFPMHYAEIADELGDHDLRDLIAIYNGQLRMASKRRKRADTD